MAADLYHVKQLFTTGGYKRLAELSPPDSGSEDAHTILLYQARANIALGQPQKALAILPADSASLAVKAVRAFAQYVQGEDTLEELRDLCVEIEGEDVEADDAEKSVVRVVAGTAFARAGETEEALETLGAGGSTEDLEAVAITVQVYLSIRRADLARREFARAAKWAEDDLLLQHIEASVGLVTGADGYANPHAYYVEQASAPTLSGPHLTFARGVTHVLRGEVPEAAADFAEALKGGAGADAMAGAVVAASLGAGKKGDADALLARLQSEHAGHPMVVDLAKKSEMFDEIASNYTVPPLAPSIAA